MQNKYEFKQKNKETKPSYAFQGSYNNMLINGVEAYIIYKWK